jgi:zinc transport system ATP-binding protein
MEADTVITLDHVTFSYNGRPVIENASLSIAAREFVWVVGPNGGGKTTMVKLILGLLEPGSGTVRVFGDRPVHARRRIGYMPQHARLDPSFPVSVMDVTLMGRLGSRFRVGRYSSEDREAASRALKEVELLEYRDAPIASLSGGQQRRLLIARALAVEPELLILDEPMANLDVRAERELKRLLRRLNEHLTILMVSHDPALVADHVERVVCVKRHVHVHPTSKLDSDFIKELYDAPVRVVRHDVRDSGQEEA